MSCSCKEHDHSHCRCGHEEHRHETQGEKESGESRKRDYIEIGLSVVLFVTTFFVPQGIVKWVLFGAAYLCAGYRVILGAIEGIIHGDFFDEETLMSIATVGAIAIGDYSEAVAVMILYRIGELVQDIAVERSRRRIEAAVSQHPDTATVEREGKRIIVDPETVAVGETIVIGIGDRIPLDGVVLSGSTRLDCSSLTGESNSVRVDPGDKVFSGSVNLISELKVQTTATCDESASARLLKAIDEAAETKPRMERFIKRFSKVYTPCVVGLAMLVAIIPPVLGAGSFREWIHRALTFLVISCPCALVLSIPLTFYAGLGMLTKRDMLPKSADVIERMAALKAIAFDKTGTLTTGRFSVLSVHPHGFTEEELLDYAAMAERTNPHPIASAIVAASKTELMADISENHVGKGVTANCGDMKVAVGNRKLFDELKIDLPANATGVIVAINGNYAGCIEVGDTVRDTAKEAVNELTKMNISTHMLTGDNEEAATNVARAVGVDTTASGLLPEQKVEQLQLIRKQKGAVAFIGDGMNDSPVLKGADVGIAMADRGVELAAETADMLLLSGNLTMIPKALHIAKRTLRTAKWNVAIALGIKTLAMILSAMGVVDMWIAVIADSGAALICVLVALTVFRMHPEE